MQRSKYDILPLKQKISLLEVALNNHVSTFIIPLDEIYDVRETNPFFLLSHV